MARLKVVVFMLLCLVAVHVSGEPNQTAHTKKQPAKAESPPTTTTVENNNYESRTDSDHAHNKPPKWYASPEWWIVIAAIPSIILIWYQAGETARAARATQENVQLIINSGRARLTVELKDFSWTEEGGAHGVHFNVCTYGPSAAFIVNAQCAAAIFPKGVLEEPDLLDRAMIPFFSFPPVINSGSEPIEQFGFLGMADDETIKLEMPEVQERRMLVIIRGEIEYRDVYGKNRVTRFRYFYDYAIPGVSEGWIKCGPPEQNEAT